MSRQLGAIWEAAVKNDFILVRANNKGRNKWNCTLLDGTFHPPVTRWEGYYDIDTLISKIAELRVTYPVGPEYTSNACSVAARYEEQLANLRSNTPPLPEEQEEEITEVPESPENDYENTYATGYQDGFEAAVSSGNSSEELTQAAIAGEVLGKRRADVAYGEALNDVQRYWERQALVIAQVQETVYGNPPPSDLSTEAKANIEKNLDTIVRNAKVKHGY